MEVERDERRAQEEREREKVKQAPAKVTSDRGDFEMDAPDEEDVRRNLNVMSFTESVGPLSFVDERQAFEILTPPPKYLNDDILSLYTGPDDKAQILKDFNVDEQGYLVVTNEDVVQR